jgi:hypothetical protein
MCYTIIYLSLFFSTTIEFYHNLLYANIDRSLFAKFLLLSFGSTLSNP